MFGHPATTSELVGGQERGAEGAVGLLEREQRHQRPKSIGVGRRVSVKERADQRLSMLPHAALCLADRVVVGLCDHALGRRAGAHPLVELCADHLQKWQYAILAGRP